MWQTAVFIQRNGFTLKPSILFIESLKGDRSLCAIATNPMVADHGSEEKQEAGGHRNRITS